MSSMLFPRLQLPELCHVSCLLNQSAGGTLMVKFFSAVRFCLLQ